MSEHVFRGWPKIPRLSNETMIISEKLDGTSGCVWIGENGEIGAQSRNRIITPTDDNMGFARWVYENSESLALDLGPGYHHGEWWGQGIQRKYGMDHKVYSLFATHRWNDKRGHFQTENLDVVPLLHTGPVDPTLARYVNDELRETGSKAAPGYADPEGIVVYLTATGVSWKLTDAPSGPSKPRVEGE